jgi:putative endonuclease
MGKSPADNRLASVAWNIFQFDIFCLFFDDICHTPQKEKAMNRERALLKTFGNESEELATRYLEDAGFMIVERNFYARKLGEIDIIAQKRVILHFIEVKSGRADFDPVYNVTPAKIRKVINSAYYYLKVKNLDTPFSIDALIIRKGSVELIENITL